MDLIGQGISTNPRRKTSFTGADGSQTTGIMNPLGLTQNDPSVGYMGETAAPAPQAQPTSTAPTPVQQDGSYHAANESGATAHYDSNTGNWSGPGTSAAPAMSNAAMATPNLDTGREQYIAQSQASPAPNDPQAFWQNYTDNRRDLISKGMPGQSLQPTGGATDQAADPYITGVQGSSIGRQIQGQQPQQMDAPLQPLAPQYGPSGAPSWGGPRFMNGGRRRLPYAPPVSPVSQ